ncbi:MAG: TonB C-terminal domain-containing protein [Acidobacteria bacterium]|nr:TonB C-terminal domain-containing protein [Acidobacteriota bacterium]
MSSTEALHADHVYAILARRQKTELRFRSAIITSTALHTGATLAILLAPLLIPKPVVLFEFTPVNLVELTPQPESPPPPEAGEPTAPEPDEGPEPEDIEPPPPDDVPEDLEAQRRQEEEEEVRRREEERRRQEELEAQRRDAEEAARRRRDEQERRRREEEEAQRRAPQKAARQEVAPAEPQEITQQARRGQVGLSLTNDTGTVSEQDQTLLQFWINRVLANIATKWDPPSRPPGSQEILAVVRFRVGRNGRIIVDPDTRSSSGNRRYDAAAVRAILAGQPFPPLPQAYRGNTLGINLGFRQ